MGLVKFLIILDQPVYYSGQTLSGRLEVMVDAPTSMKAIYLKYSGKGYVKWDETNSRTVSSTNSDGSTSNTSETYTESYTNNEIYLDLQQLVFGNDEDCELAEGKHVFVFNCKLPMNLPTSFEGVHGHVRYSIKATIKRNTWKSNHVVEHPVTVMSVFDLNLIPLAAVPVAEQTSKTFWGHARPLFMSVSLPVRGFVPGQIVPIRVSLNNESGVRVKSIVITLQQRVTFHSTSKSKTVPTDVCKNKLLVRKGLGYEDVPLDLQLPAVPPSYLQFCRIIDVSYQLNVEAKVNAWYHKNLKMQTEVIVGNVPLMNYQIPFPVGQRLHDPIDHGSPSHSRAAG